jgi:hypothetical protein
VNGGVGLDSEANDLTPRSERSFRLARLRGEEAVFGRRTSPQLYRAVEVASASGLCAAGFPSRGTTLGDPNPKCAALSRSMPSRCHMAFARPRSPFTERIRRTDQADTRGLEADLNRVLPDGFVGTGSK